MARSSTGKRRAAASKRLRASSKPNLESDGILEPAPLASFAKFSELPVDIRVMIWAMAIDSVPLQGRELTVSAWGHRFSDIPHSSIAENWTEPWSEVISPPFNSTELEDVAAHGAISEAINFQGPRIQEHVQQLLSSCRESRGEVLRRYIRFSGNARRCDFLMFSHNAGQDQFPSSSDGRKRKAQIVGKSGAEHYQLDTKHSKPTYFNVEVDWLCFSASSFRNVQVSWQVSTLDEILERWLPNLVLEKLRFLLIDVDNVKLHRERTQHLLLKFKNLEKLILFKVGSRYSRYYLPEPKPLITEAFVQSLAEENPGWKKPRVIWYGRTKYGHSAEIQPYGDLGAAFYLGRHSASTMNT